MSEIENAHDTECQRKPHSQQCIYAAQKKAADENLDHSIVDKDFGVQYSEFGGLGFERSGF
jgi:hypothetical protein